MPLSDISATRAAEGFDDGFAMAEVHASAFHEILGEFQTHYRQSGATDRLETAIAMGATHVRVGSALFGHRGALA